jgi:translation initiation factor 4A|uniref:RNA helicase n=1 Tax=viral metagenome TaxID=1070528 RepID=A0A6C0IDX2_9ZZZZ
MASPSNLKTYETFDEMGLNDSLLRGIYSYGYERPSKIQQLAIVPIKEGNDILAQAQSGTGKSCSFIVGSMSVIDVSLQKLQVMVLVPTQELAKQIYEVAKSLGSYLPVSCYSATGGTPIREDMKAIDNGVQFIVGTPGRIFDLINRKVLRTDNIRSLIMDEADQMLEDRFYKQVMCILEMGFPKTTKVALFSATMPKEVIEVADKLLQNPVRILVPPEEVTLDGIKQYCVVLEKEEWKYDVLCDIYKQLNINQAIIYCNKRQRAEWLAEKLSADGYPLSCIHGEMENDERRRRMQEFRSGTIRVLISTDLLARGIDVQQVSLVINFELPMNRENYIHRIGRSGRYGRKGVAINLISSSDTKNRTEIETHYSTKMIDLPDDLSGIVLI